MCMINEMKRRIDELESQLYWQPIESAPSDGSEFIARGFHDSGGREEMKACTVIKHYGSFLRDNNGYGFTVTCYPTHWTPMPDAPR